MHFSHRFSRRYLLLGILVLLSTYLSLSPSFAQIGQPWAWGWNGLGQLGDGTNYYSSSYPVQVSGLSGVVQVAEVYYHSLALKSDGTVWAWGDNVSEIGRAHV